MPAFYKEMSYAIPNELNRSIYSEDEHIVGTWFDGRPVYEITRVLQFPATVSSEYKKSGTMDVEYETIISVVGSVKMTSGQNISFEHGGPSSNWSGYTIQDNDIYLFVNHAQIVNATWFGTIRYIKAA